MVIDWLDLLLVCVVFVLSLIYEPKSRLWYLHVCARASTVIFSIFNRCSLLTMFWFQYEMYCNSFECCCTNCVCPYVLVLVHVYPFWIRTKFNSLNIFRIWLYTLKYWELSGLSCCMPIHAMLSSVSRTYLQIHTRPNALTEE